MVNTVENQILNLDPQAFNAALAELQLGAEREADLRRQYRRANSVFSPIYGLLDQISSGDEAAGRVRGNVVPMTRPQGMTGLEAIMGGQAELAVPGTLMDLIGAVPMAIDAPVAAYQGGIPAEDMVGEATNIAGLAATGGVASMGRGAFDFDPTIMAANARDPRLYHPASRTKLRMPVDEMRFEVSPIDNLQPARYLSLEDLQGEVLVPAFGDRTRAGGILTRINDEELSSPVELQGGADFMRSPGGIWASEPDAMRTKASNVRQIAEREDQIPIMAYTSMGAQSGDFSRMMSDAIMGQIRPSMANMVDADAVARYDSIIRDKVDPNWPGIMSEGARDYVSNMTGTNRRELWQQMDKAAFRNAGFPDVGATRLAITDPRLVEARPFDTGLTFGRLDENIEPTPTPRDIHATYGSQVQGEYLGGLLDQVPGEFVWRDFFNARREAGASPSSDQRSFMMSPTINQRVDQQMIDEVGAYLENLRRTGMR